MSGCHFIYILLEIIIVPLFNGEFKQKYGKFWKILHLYRCFISNTNKTAAFFKISEWSGLVWLFSYQICSLYNKELRREYLKFGQLLYFYWCFNSNTNKIAAFCKISELSRLVWLFSNKYIIVRSYNILLELKRKYLKFW